ncbi:MAG TPA: imidazole glycerol phosphate synthase subunit HisH [Candidatus Sulfotelmatobacter sp.]|nr:imidazole glycerol phosphate synthase subunit HisH [Candidatus Sulfotelmatobacter sp.]
MIAIIDYGAGNPVSVKKALDWLGRNCVITPDPVTIRRGTKVILPGVGHFSSTQALARSGVQTEIATAVNRGTPFLGICVGMQWMFDGSEEAPQIAGSSMLPGQCHRFPDTLKLPHVGWNQLEIDSTSKLFQGIPQSSLVYFTHSYYAPVNESTVACCQYGQRFSAAVERDNIFGVQFHPEKSGEVGLNLLANFCAF